MRNELAKTTVTLLDERRDETATASIFSEAVREMVRKARAENTRATYARLLRRFSSWCEEHGTDVRLASVPQIADYLVGLASAGLAPTTVNSHLAAIRHVRQHAGIPFDTSQFEGVMDGIRREHARPAKKSRAATLDTIESTVAGLGDSVKDARDRALLLVGYHAARRRSELAGLDYETRGDGAGVLRLVPDGILIELYRSKTNQHAKPEQYGIPANVSGVVEAVRHWINVAGIEPGSALFRAINKGGKVGKRISGESVGDIIGKLGIGYSGHALRRGFITDAANEGLDALRIARQSGHKSLDMVRQYVDEAELFKNNTAGQLAAVRRAKRGG